jgi:hypothetical protein
MYEDFINGYLGVYNKPKIKQTLWQRIVYAIKKPITDNIWHPMKWKLINLTCLVKGHEFKLLFRPDFRKGRDTWFHFFCERCCVGVDITYTKKDKEAS